MLFLLSLQEVLQPAVCDGFYTLNDVLPSLACSRPVDTLLILCQHCLFAQTLNLFFFSAYSPDTGKQVLGN